MTSTLGSVGRTKAASSSGAALTPPQCDGGSRLSSTTFSTSVSSAASTRMRNWACLDALMPARNAGSSFKSQAADMVSRLVGNALNTPDTWREEWRFRCEMHRKVGEVASDRIFDCKFANDRNGVLVKSDVDVIRRNATDLNFTSNFGCLETLFHALPPSRRGQVSWLQLERMPRRPLACCPVIALCLLRVTIGASSAVWSNSEYISGGAREAPDDHRSGPRCEGLEDDT